MGNKSDSVSFEVLMDKYVKGNISTYDIPNDLVTKEDTWEMVKWIVMSVSSMLLHDKITLGQEKFNSLLIDLIRDNMQHIAKRIERQYPSIYPTVDLVLNGVTLSTTSVSVTIKASTVVYGTITVNTSATIVVRTVAEELLADSLYEIVHADGEFNATAFYNLCALYEMFNIDFSEVTDICWCRKYIYTNRNLLNIQTAYLYASYYNKLEVKGFSGMVYCKPSIPKAFEILTTCINKVGYLMSDRYEHDCYKFTVDDFYAMNKGVNFLCTDSNMSIGEEFTMSDIYTQFELLDGVTLAGIKLSHYHFNDNEYLILSHKRLQIWEFTKEKEIIDKIAFIQLNGNYAELTDVLCEYVPEGIQDDFKQLREVAEYYCVNWKDVDYWLKEAADENWRSGF